MTEPQYLNKGAIFSNDRKYRYKLWRTWDINKPSILFIMLNPSTADENILDPTLRRCLGYAMKWGYGTMYICNLFALRSTNPKELYISDDSIGPDNNRYIRETANECEKIILAWGNHGNLDDRYIDVIELLTEPIEYPLFILARTKMLQPSHPLYLKGDLIPVKCE
jgi:hypothetical protein